MTFTVRRARPEDASRLGEIHVRSWQQGYAGLLPADVLDRLDPVARGEWWGRMLADQAATTDDAPGWLTSVAECDDDGVIVGFVGSGPSRHEPETPATAEIFQYVDPTAWREGVGRALMTTALARLVHVGHTDAMLRVLEGNDRAIAFYEATGWRPDGERHVEEIWGATTAQLTYRHPLAGAIG